ncbi:MAG TPA: CheR family methyltransferase [Leptospiraceae bacterium]|nr:CheR family methyltransferase [Leptospiraceae bacterium]
MKNDETKLNTVDFPIVGIGASAGGLAAFEAFFSGMPPIVNPNMAFVIVQHLAPDHKSILTELIQRYTRMQVLEVEDGIKVKPNCAYIIPPNRDMTFLNGSLYLKEPSSPRGQRLPIDFFFRSLALDQKEKAICIVLSGNGNDGTIGVRAIKGEGGMAMAQNPETTEYDGMPRSAIATGLMDFISPAKSMPAELIQYVEHSFGKLPKMISSADTKELFDKIFALLKVQTSHDFSEYKPTTINRRIERRIAVHHIDSMENYFKYLQKTPLEVQMLYHDLLIGVTSFFRDTEIFRILENQIIPKIFANKQAGAVIRIWSTGCSTGEEPYSLAILFQEYLDRAKQNFKLQIFATDIDSRAITIARTGSYSSNITLDVTPERLAQYFTFDESKAAYRISKSIRDMVVFSEQNIIKDPPFSKIDLISCRNLMIYMNGNLQKRIIPLFHYALNPEGILFLGNSETIGDFGDLFSVEDRKAKVYQRKEVFRNISQTMFGKFHSMPGLPAVNVSSHPEKLVTQTKLPFKELTEKALLQQIAPNGALINAAGDILYLYGRAGVYLELPAGEFGTSNIIKLAKEGLKQDLMIALSKAANETSIVHRSGIYINIEGSPKNISITIRPVLSEFSEGSSTPLFLVVLEEETIPVQKEKPYKFADDSSSDVNEYITQLKQELKTKEEFLQNLNEELETSNDNLKSFNEEMQSVNEELQSTNEELETSKEELQSVNEELATINTELQTKVTDLSRVNNDMNNLLAGTGIATIFLDLSLRILRFTPTAIKIINLIPTDVGRPVAHVVSNLIGYTTLVDDLQEVLDSLIQKQVEVQIQDDKWYTMRIQPYRTLENVIEGAVITFSEITERRIAEQKVKELLENNEVLLREVHHRIKNHMASVFSLLSLQSTNASEAIVATALRDAANRVQSMMVLYDQLNQSKNLDKISAKKYLTTLVDQILGNSQIASWIKTERNIMDFELDVNRLQSLGLIVNELLTNTIKYAFKDRQEGFIKIEMLVVDQTVFVSVEDNGNGIAESIDFESSTGFGLKLVKMLSKHLSGKIAIIRNKGTKITIEFHL